MTKMSTATDTVNLGAVHPEACVIGFRNRMDQRLPEARPTGVAVILRRRREDRQVTSRAGIGARPRLEVELAGERGSPYLPVAARRRPPG